MSLKQILWMSECCTFWSVDRLCCCQTWHHV